MGFTSLTARLKSELFSYETPKLVVIESKFIGVLHKFMQLSLFMLVIIWVFILNNGYQYIDNGAIDGSTSKIKGVSYSNSTDERIGKRIWDSADLHVPPQDNGAFFITTNVIITKDQVQTTCPDIGWSTKCSKDSDCLPPGQPYHLGHGISVGICNTSHKHCVVQAWCPIEDDSPPDNEKDSTLKHIKGFTVMIKNHVYFPFYERSRSNLIESITKEKLRGCRYHPVESPFCPIFRLGDIVGLAHTGVADTPEANDEYFEKMVIKGGVISITINWDCDFDFHESACKPKYRFNRLDNESNAVSKGYNFRYPIVYVEDGIQKRVLVKAYGILFLLKTDAVARKFDLTTFLLNVGSALALLGIASLISEICLLHIHKNKKYFKKYKMEPRVTLERRANETKVAEETSDVTKKDKIPSV